MTHTPDTPLAAPKAEVRLDAIDARLAMRTPGPWRAAHDAERIAVVAEDPEAPVQPFAVVTCAYHSDADLIAHAPDDIAWLITQVRALQSERAFAARALAEAMDAHESLVADHERVLAELHRLRADAE